MGKPITGKPNKLNTSGIVGVSFNKASKVWEASYKGKYIASFKNKQDAIDCRDKAVGFKYKETEKVIGYINYESRDFESNNKQKTTEEKLKRGETLRKLDLLREKKELDSLDDY